MRGKKGGHGSGLLLTAQLLLVAQFLHGCSTVTETRNLSVTGPGAAQCPVIEGRYYNFPEMASARLFSTEPHDRVSCRDTEFCTLSRIFDEETGYVAAVVLEQPASDTLVFRSGQEEISLSRDAGDFSCDGANLTIPEDDPAGMQEIRHLSQLSVDGDGSLVARVGIYAPAGGGSEAGGVAIVDNAWLRFPAVEPGVRTDWQDPVAIREHLGSSYLGQSLADLDSSFGALCEVANRDRALSSPARMEYGWWFRESLWASSSRWSSELVDTLRAHGIRPDNRLAWMWLDLAGKQYSGVFSGRSRSMDTGNAVEALEAEMSAIEIEDAREMAEAWTPDDCASSGTVSIV